MGNTLPLSANLLPVSAPLPILSLSGYLGALAGDSGCFPFDDEAYSPIISLADLDPCYFEVISSIQSLPQFSTALAARTETMLYPYMSSQLLRLNTFRGEPGSFGFEWHFTPNHNSSTDSSTSVSSNRHLVSLTSP
ncbi:hypothetical protein Goari_023414 [Gossypium aridum]|uniref:Uncharacterized protein n=1 Tax=Gossypium aridum TaxID=34290 RepID=A0A7J8X2X3_GOSAI|nr:hypothetical protein [Gossypium aridum]